MTRASECEYRTGQIPPGIETYYPFADPSHRSFSVNIPITVTVSASITPNESTSSHTLVSHLTGLDLALSRLADFGNVYNGTIDQAWEMRNMRQDS